MTILCFLIAGTAFSQTDYSKIPLKTKEDCKAAEPSVLEACGLILSKPMDDPGASKAMSFLITWMSNTTYSFTLDEKITKLAKKKTTGLLGIYMASMAKVVLEDPSKAKDTIALEEAAFGLLADYCADASKNVPQTKAVKKLIEAKNSGKMREYVGGK
jgi:hypothetical protein